MIRVKKEEGHYTLKRVKVLPPRGNHNLLYAFIGNTIDRLYRWTLEGKYEEILLGDSTGGKTVSGVINETTGVVTFTREDLTTFDVDLSSLSETTTVLQVFDSLNLATAALGSGVKFRYSQTNIDGVPSPNGSSIGITQ